MPRHWKNDEIALACQAYISATDNPINGTDQDYHTFALDIVDRFKQISSADCADGTYFKRGVRVYPYLRDNVFPEVQKFQKALRVVSVSDPTGVTEKEKVNMAVAIHCKETNKMEYKYKSYDPNEWKYYQAYLHLKTIPKFANLPSTVVVEERVESSDPTSESEPNRSAESRGVGRGKKASKAVKMRELKESKKRTRDEERERKLDAMMEEMAEMKKILKNKSAAAILTKAMKATDDEEVKKRLKHKLVQLALDLD